MFLGFLGTHTPKLDDKGRLTLPAKYRDHLVDGLVITRGQERCLYVFAPEDFLKAATAMQAAPTTSRGVRDFMRMFLSGASDETPDRQGRITIPPVLREYAGLERECTVIGAGSRFEIWNETAWQEYSAQVEPAYADQSEEVIPGIL